LPNATSRARYLSPQSGAHIKTRRLAAWFPRINTGESDQCSDDDKKAEERPAGSAREGPPQTERPRGRLIARGQRPLLHLRGVFRGATVIMPQRPTFVCGKPHRSLASIAPRSPEVTSGSLDNLLVPQPRPPVAGLFLWNPLRRGALHRRPGSWWPKTPRLQPSCRGPGPPPL